MDSRREITFQALGELLSYPSETYLQAAELLYVVLQSDLPEAAQSISQFGEFIESRELHELEENFARTFDINPACALEIGWHLFGEEYARGSLLVRLRGEMRTHGVEESAELPDHISHVLSLLAVMDDGAARRLARACVMPAVLKMHKALDGAGSEYRHVTNCLNQVLQSEFGPYDAEEITETGLREAVPSMVTQNLGSQTDLQFDLLRAYPMPCGSCSPEEPIQIQLNGDAAKDDVSAETPKCSSRPSEAGVQSTSEHNGPCQGGCHG